MKSDLEMTDNSKPSNLHRNVLKLLVRREICPRTKCAPKKEWRGASERRSSLCYGPKDQAGVRDAKRGLVYWVEEASLQHLSAKYCPLVPPPRSTIAAAFSPDGKTLASTHGDHTVKIIDCETEKCIKVLIGHRRTPWVVRFHPLRPEIIASGSLDQEVRLWNVKTAKCIGFRDFYRPIASIAFHAEGELLAVASGHKLYIWQYNKGPESSSPTIVLKTRRSLRAVHFHPYGAPFLMTAEVNDLDFSGASMTRATSSDGPRIPLPHFTEVSSSSSMQVESSARRQLQADTSVSQLYDYMVFPVDNSAMPTGLHSISEETENGYGHDSVRGSAYNSVAVVAGTNEMNPVTRSQPGSSNSLDRSSDPRPAVFEPHGLSLNNHGLGATNVSGVPGGSSLSHQVSLSYVLGLESGDGPAYVNLSESGSGILSRAEAEIAKSLDSTAQELPCTVKLRVWSHNVSNPCAPLIPERCRMIIPHAVLCSEMGAHFSPCGRYLAACVACLLPNTDCDPGLRSLSTQDVGTSTSPTRHPISLHQLTYELRIYSLEEATFGSMLVSRVIRAAHCLTSIQFSPTSEHILLAYGRRHGSLLKCVIIDEEATLPIYTVLEVYRLPDLELVRVLPSAEDEVNVACFHPYAGGGLVYGTKEGKLRMLQCDGNNETNCTVPNYLLNVHAPELNIL